MTVVAEETSLDALTTVDGFYITPDQHEHFALMSDRELMDHVISGMVEAALREGRPAAEVAADHAEAAANAAS